VGEWKTSSAEVFSALLKLNGDGRDHRNSLAPPIIIAHPPGTLLAFVSELYDWSAGRYPRDILYIHWFFFFN
jgi:hypothetical protein